MKNVHDRKATLHDVTVSMSKIKSSHLSNEMDTFLKDTATIFRK
jgi:hypothetical protein